MTITSNEVDEVFTNPSQEQINKFVTIREECKAITNSEDLVLFEEGIPTYWLTSSQVKTLQSLIDIQRTKLWIEKNYKAPDANVERVKESFKEIDDVQFWPTEVKIEPMDIPTKTGTIAVPLEAELKKPKTTKAPKPIANVSDTLESTNSYTIKRRVNLPIDGVQYSNNEVQVEVTSTSREDAMTEVAELLELQLKDLKLTSSANAKAYGDKRYEEGYLAWKSEAPANIQTPDADMKYKYDRATAFVSQLQTDPEFGKAVRAKLQLFLSTYPKQ